MHLAACSLHPSLALSKSECGDALLAGEGVVRHTSPIRLDCAFAFDGVPSAAAFIFFTDAM